MCNLGLDVFLIQLPGVFAAIRQAKRFALEIVSEELLDGVNIWPTYLSLHRNIFHLAVKFIKPPGAAGKDEA